MLSNQKQSAAASGEPDEKIVEKFNAVKKKMER
jgi:hypothetical protein